MSKQQSEQERPISDAMYWKLAWPALKRDGTLPYGDDERRKRFNVYINTYVEAQLAEANEEQLSRIYNLANEYACSDKTMVGSESIRGYHYFNALEKVKLELSTIPHTEEEG